MNRRAFPIGSVLMLAVGSEERPLCPIGDLYDVLGHMLGDVPGAGDVDEFIDRCRPAVAAQHPQMAKLTPPDVDAPDEDVLAWIKEQSIKFGKAVELDSIAVRGGGTPQ